MNPGNSKPVNLRTVFRVYSFIFRLLGLSLLVWGRTWFGDRAWAIVYAVVFLGTGYGAELLSRLKEEKARYRAFFWFLIWHVVLWMGAEAGHRWFGVPGTLYLMVPLLTAIVLTLLSVWLRAKEEMWRVSPGSQKLRSQYERTIRQAGAQEERNRLARDLHDSIKQQIFAIQTAAATAQVRYEGGADGVGDALDQIRGAAREAMTEMEVMLDQLRAEPLEHAGLVTALGKLCQSVGFRTGARVEFEIGTVPDVGSFATEAAEAILRVAQEALANVARHARASHVVVTLDSVKGRTELTVEDDGMGFDTEASSCGMGTANMRARAEELGGTFEIVSRPEAGTTVKFSIPSAGTVAAGAWGPNHVRVLTFVVWPVTIFLFIVMQPGSLIPGLIFATSLAVSLYMKYRRSQ